MARRRFPCDPPRTSRNARTWACVTLGLLAANLLAAWASADGLHCRVLDGDDLEAAWRRLVKATWPERADGSTPRITSHKGRPQIELAIRELLATLQFVDPYNYADDSPAWMSTEEGRNKAREQARKIVIELGRGSAPLVWQALELEVRFANATEGVEAAVRAFRQAQRKLQDALSQLEIERRKDAAYQKASDAFEHLRPRINTLAYLEKSVIEFRRLRIAASGQPEKLKTLEAELSATEARAKASGPLSELNQQFKDLQGVLSARGAELSAEPKVAERQEAVTAARVELDRAMKKCASLGQGFLESSDPTMVTADDYVGDLTGALIEMGPEALPQVLIGKRSPNPALRKSAVQIETAWCKPAWVKPFALAAADGKTQVALAATRFFKETLKRQAVAPLLEALAKAPAAEHAALYAGLKACTGMDLPSELKAWTEWWMKTQKETRPDQTVPDE